MERFSTYKKRKTQSTIINVIPIKIPTRYPVDIDRLLLKSVRKGKRPRIANTILKEKKKVRELSSLNFKTSYKAAAIETVQDSERQTRKSMGQKREPGNRPPQMQSTDRDKGTKQHLPQMLLEQLDIPQTKLETDFTPFTKGNSK